MKTIYNKLVELIFSPSTPAQLLLVALLGFVFGFIPGFTYAPFLFVLVIFLVLILRVNIGLFVLFALIAKALSFPLESVSFSLGRFLLDGFTQPIFKLAVNTPVLAYAGFDYYLVTGAFVVAIVLGAIFGIFIAKVYKKLVNKMASLQTESQLYQKTASKLSIKIASKIIFGKNISKIDWKVIQARRFRQPIRLLGLLIVLVVSLVIAFTPKMLETAMVSNIIKQQLTKVNGATVDYDSIHLDLNNAKLALNGLGATNPSDLTQDRFYAKTVSANIDITKLLTKQIVLNNVVVDGIDFTHKRKSKGALYTNKASTPTENPDQEIQKTMDNLQEVGKKFQQVDIAKVTENAQKTNDIAKGVKQSIDVLSNFRPTKTTENNQPIANDTKAKVYGYANVRAESLRDQTPNFVIQKMKLKGFENNGTKYDADITNLSTNPALLAKPTQIHIKSTNNENLHLGLVMSNQVGDDNTIKFDFKNFKDKALKDLAIQGAKLNANKVDVSGKGTWNFSGVNNITFNIPLQLKLSDITIAVAQVKQDISNLVLQATLTGDLNNVGFGIDTSSLKDTLNTATVKNVASDIVEKSNLDEKAKDLISKTKINGKSVEDLDAKDVQGLASQFGLSI